MCRPASRMSGLGRVRRAVVAGQDGGQAAAAARARCAISSPRCALPGDSGRLWSATTIGCNGSTASCAPRSSDDQVRPFRLAAGLMTDWFEVIDTARAEVADHRPWSCVPRRGGLPPQPSVSSYRFTTVDRCRCSSTGNWARWLPGNGALVEFAPRALTATLTERSPATPPWRRSSYRVELAEGPAGGVRRVVRSRRSPLPAAARSGGQRAARGCRRAFRGAG